MDIAFDYAILGGIIAAFVMVVAMYAGRIMGLATDMIRVIGLMFVPEEKAGAVYAVGFVVHFLTGAVFGIVYAVLFHAIAAVPVISIAATAGALFGILHGLSIGAILGFMPAFHPRMGVGEAVAPPGFFGRNVGLAMPVGLIILHVIYGAIVGVVYGTRYLVF
ncbi:MAG: hypothetical protein ACNA8W_12045 [Bradymonadaceae bacterium]